MFNVVLMGFAFMFIFTAFQTCSEIEVRMPIGVHEMASYRFVVMECEYLKVATIK